jgi:hypothetical protein
MESFRIHFALAITIDAPERTTIPGIVKTYARFRYFDGIVGFLASGLTEKKHPAEYLKDESTAIDKQLAITPTGYIPSNLDDNEIRWLLYYFMIDSHSGTIFPLQNALSQCFCNWFSKISGRFPFTLQLPPIISALSCVTIVLTSPKRFLDLRQGISAIFNLCVSVFSSRFFYIVFQVPPEFDANTDTIELCCCCPDATIRNGKLLSLCLADFISPFNPLEYIPGELNRNFTSVINYLNPPEKESL